MKHKILLLYGSTPAAVQVLTVLNTNKYEVHVADPNQFCWARFHRRCTKFILSPRLSANPNIYLRFLINILKKEKYSVILPVHEEGLFLARHKNNLQKYTKIPLDDAATFHLLMNKKLCLTKAQSLGIPVPKMKVIKVVLEVKNLFPNQPFYLKSPYGTSSLGVIRINNQVDYQEAINRFSNEPELIAQEEVIGQQSTIQSLFLEGKLIAAHQYLALSTGPGGGASHRLSQNDTDIKSYAEKLGKSLKWTGPLMLDFIRDAKTGIAFLIEGNPRIGETFNANLSGVNIPETMINIAIQDRPLKRTSQNNIQSHQTSTEIAGLVNHNANLPKKYLTTFDCLLHKGRYQKSVEEFLNFLDPYYLALITIQILALPFLSPSFLSKINKNSAKNMSLNRSTIETILNSD